MSDDDVESDYDSELLSDSLSDTDSELGCPVSDEQDESECVSHDTTATLGGTDSTEVVI